MQGSAGTRADINIRNNQNETPLHVSLKNYVVLSCIDSLLQRGEIEYVIVSRRFQDIPL